MKAKKDLIEGEDYYISEQGHYWIFTEKYHLDRGYCCKSVKQCKHCPFQKVEKLETKK